MLEVQEDQRDLRRFRRSVAEEGYELGRSKSMHACEGGAKGVVERKERVGNSRM